MLALSSLSSIVVIILAVFVYLREGILGCLPSPGGLLRYLLAIQISSADISSKKFSQCCHLVSMITSPYLLLFHLSSLCE